MWPNNFRTLRSCLFVFFLLVLWICLLLVYFWYIFNTLFTLTFLFLKLIIFCIHYWMPFLFIIMFVYIFLKFIHISQYIISNNHNIGVFVVYFNQEYYIIGTKYDNKKTWIVTVIDNYQNIYRFTFKEKTWINVSFKKDCSMYMYI